MTWFSGTDLWAGSIYFKGGCHLVFAKIVERRPQNSRPGLPRLRSRIPGSEAGAWDINERAAEAEKGHLSLKPEAQEWPSGCL